MREECVFGAVRFISGETHPTFWQKRVSFCGSLCDAEPQPLTWAVVLFGKGKPKVLAKPLVTGLLRLEGSYSGCSACSEKQATEKPKIL